MRWGELFEASDDLTKIETPKVGSGIRFAAIVAASTAVVIVSSIQAHALPSFARQTGQPCGACHIDFPTLTPFGRQFKLNGYTAGGGRFRTTLFPTQGDATKALSDYEKKTGQGTDIYSARAREPDARNVWVPPISMMAIVGLTHTQAPQDPTGSPYRANDNVVVSPVSFFYGGAITEHVGAFAQLTYNGAPFGAQDPSDRFANYQWTWDNVDVRYANTTKLGNNDVTYGITVNNNPSVQDLWNTTPAWSFPYAVSSIAPTPGAGTLIDGTFAAHALGIGGYTFVNNLFYLELAGYRTINFHAQAKLGADPFGAPGMFDGVSPYWRIAFEPHWGNNWLQFGGFGMSARIHPWTFATGLDGFYLNQTFPQTDRYADVGFDSQYQYQGGNYWITLRGSYIHETQNLDASFAQGLASNPTNKLNRLKASASLAYGNDNRIVLTGQYFNTWGTSDPIFYSGLASGRSPNSSGYVVEIAYIPFISSNAPIWPWANVRLGLQYTYYNKFDGDTVHAHNNNTLFLYAWLAM